ncbi:MAG: tetratricopeptide repeat protein [Betaproteobacteria bacterium]|nr:tetratricopeptide repeat protein [Betaproteobacteria bacterium]
MATAPDQETIHAVGEKIRRGDLGGARADCNRFLASVTEPARQAPLRFWLGIIEQRSGDLPAAIGHFEFALAANRRNPLWLLQTGLAHFQMNAFERAESLYRQALRMEPRYPLAHYNLGVLLQQKHDWQGARRAFEAAIAHHPQFPEALVNLANVLVELAALDSAEACYRRALSINPCMANAHYGLGLHHLRGQQLSLAAQCFESVVEHDSAHLDAWLDLAECRHLSGDDARAIACVKQVLVLDAAHSTAQFKLAHYRGDQPVAAPHAMVERLYAGMAATFDEHLAQRLGYRIPALLMTELNAWLTGFAAQHSRLPNALDLGCGTGLFGQEVRPFAAKLVGVDLSGAMLAKARDRNLYDELTENNLETYLSGTLDEFDLITATDVLIYLGRLEEIFALVAARLTGGGRFAFSTETPAGLEQDYFLLPTGRYAHGTRYIERLADDHAFAVTKRVDTRIRTENGIPLKGHVFILQKA